MKKVIAPSRTTPRNPLGEPIIEVHHIQQPYELDKAKLAKVMKANLHKGGSSGKVSDLINKGIDNGVCVMNGVHALGGGSGHFTDRPENASPAITSFAISTNDMANDNDRQKLKVLIPGLANSNNPDKEEARKRMIHAWQMAPRLKLHNYDFAERFDLLKSLLAL